MSVIAYHLDAARASDISDAVCDAFSLMHAWLQQLVHEVTAMYRQQFLKRASVCVQCRQVDGMPSCVLLIDGSIIGCLFILDA